MQPDHLTISVTGDSMLSRSISVFAEEPYLHMRDILKSVDVVFTNFEANAHPYLDDPHAQRDGGGMKPSNTSSASAGSGMPVWRPSMTWIGRPRRLPAMSYSDTLGPGVDGPTAPSTGDWPTLITIGNAVRAPSICAG